MTSEQLLALTVTVPCPICGQPVYEPCVNAFTGEPIDYIAHFARIRASQAKQ